MQHLADLPEIQPLPPRNRPGRPKGLPKTGGRVKGQLNKENASIREMVVKALNMVGGEKYFAKQAEKNPSAFMALVGKVLPLQVQASGGGVLLLEQLALAAQALRERAQIAPPTPEGQVIEHGPAPDRGPGQVYKVMPDGGSSIDGLDHGYASSAEDKGK